MVGGVLVTHGTIGESLLAGLSCIGGDCRQLATVSIEPGEENEVILEQIKECLQKVDSGDGVLIFTDMFGGTPSNLSYSLFKANKVEVVTGVNLPMLLKFFNYRETGNLKELAVKVKKAGQSAISVASELSREK